MTDANDPPSSAGGNPFPVGHGSIVEGAQQDAPVPSKPPPLPPAARRKPRRSPRGMIIGLLVVLGVGAGAFGVMRLVGGARHKSLPIEAKRLPAQTRSISEEQVDASREKDASVRQTLLAAELGAMICAHGSANPANTLMALGEGGASGAKMFFKPKNLEDIQAMMECGGAMAKTMASPYVTQLQFEESEKTHEVQVAQLDLEELPSKVGFWKQQFSGLSGYCYTKPEADADDSDKKKKEPKDECDDDQFAALRDGKAWFFGKKTALDTLARSLQRPRKELTSVVETLQEAADATEGMPRRYVQAHPKSARLFLAGACNWGMTKTAGKREEFLKACFPAASERTLDAIDARVRGAAYEMDPDVERADAVKGNIVLVSRDADAARELEKDVTELVRDWKSHVENNEGKLVKLANKDPATNDERMWQAIVDTFVRAVKGAKVSQSGRTVRIAFSEKLSPSDRKELKDAVGSAKSDEKRASVAMILDALVKNQPIPEAGLAQLVGAKWAAYLAASHTELSDSDCKKIKSKLDDIQASDLGSESMALASMVRRLDCYKKTEMVETLRTCLLGVTDAASFGKCKAIEEPTEKDFGKKKEAKQGHGDADD